MDTAVCVLRGMGKAITSMVSCIAGVCGIRLVWVFTVFKYFKTLPVLYSSYAVSWLGTCTILLVALLVTFKKQEKVFSQGE